MKLAPLLFCCVFLLPFVGFWASFWLDAPVPNPLGNTPLAKYPVLKRKHWPDDVWMQKEARAVIAHAPLRYRAIKLKNEVFCMTAEALYPVPVNPGHPEVCQGKDGWLFLLNEVPPDRTEATFEAMAHRAVHLGQIITQSGRRFYFSPFPDKASVYPEYCGLVKKWAELDANRQKLPAVFMKGFMKEPGLVQSYIPVWEALWNAKRSGHELLYFEKDTHWNYAGMVVAARTMVDTIQPGLFEDSSVKREGVTHGFVPGGGHDLSTIFLLQKDQGTAPVYTVHREGGDPVREGVHFRSRQQAVIKGRTIIINDSFAEWAAPLLTPWFEDLVFFHHDLIESEEMEKCLQESDTVIWTSVERYLPARLEKWEDYLTKKLRPKPAPVVN